MSEPISPGLSLETMKIEIQVKMEPETQKDNIKVEPEHNYNVFGMENNVVSKYYQNPYITEDNMMTQSEYHTDSETTYTEIGMMDNTSNNKQDAKVWKHFEKVEDDDCAVCKYCHKMFTYKSSSSNLFSHLKRAHLTVYNDHWQLNDQPVASTSKDYPETKVQLDIECVQPENPKKPALAWDHFHRVDQCHAVCKHCKKKLSYKTTTGNLNAHMRGVHKPILIKYLKTLENNSSSIEQELEVESSFSNNDETTSDSCSKFGVIWKYFDKLGEEYAMCKECYKELSCKTTTGNLGTHLKRSHPSLYSQYRSITDREPNESTLIDIGEDITLPTLLLNHFEKIARYTVMCKYCSRKLPLSITSGSLSRHLRITHPEVYLEYKTSKRNTFSSSLQNDSGTLSDSGDNSETEREDERILFDEWKKKGGVWAHYVQDKNRCAICKYCQKSISYKATTGNLGSHLRRAHKPLYMNKKSEKTETGTVNISSTTKVSEEVHVSETDNQTHNAGTTKINTMELKQSSNVSTNETSQSDKPDKIKCDSSADEGNMKPTHKFHEVLIKLENTVNDKIINKPFMSSDSLEKPEIKPKSNTYNKELNDNMQKEDAKTSVDISETKISMNVEQNIKQCDTESIIDLENIEDIALDDVSDLDGSITPKNVNEILIETLSINAKESNSPFKLKRLDIIWKCFEKLNKKSCKCKTCQQIFTSHKEAPLTIHLKVKHPSVYKKFLGVKMNENMHIQFIYQHYNRESSVIAQCKYCNVFLYNWTLRRLIAHLEKHHPRLYMEYNSIKKNQNKTIALAKLKKNAIPSVFLREEHLSRGTTSGFKKQNNILEENNMAVAQIENTPELPVTANNVGLSQNTEAETAFAKTECRACLKNCNVSVGLYDLFQPWFLPWDGMDSTVAADLAKIAKIQVSSSDIHSKFICHSCCVKLRDACEFTASVKRNDQILRLRCMQTGGLPIDKWPKPIKLDMSVDTTVMEVDIKQEIVSEYECDNESMENNDFNPPNPDFEPVDIKVEPEEIVAQNPSDIVVNGILAEELTPNISGSNNSDENTQDNDTSQSESATEANASANFGGKLVRRDFCLFCEKLVVGFSKHITKMHAYESEMRPIMMCPKQSVERKKLVSVLRKKGNYTYQEHLASNPEGEMNEAELVPCTLCFGIFKKKLLSKHQKICHEELSTVRAKTKAQNFQLKLSDVDKRLLEEVFPTMRTNRISVLAMRDKLIRSFGADYIKQHKNTTYVNVTSRKMRELAKVLIEMQKMDSSIQSFMDALQPKNYKLLVKATKLISGYNEKTDQFARPTLALNICPSYKQCCYLALDNVEELGINRKEIEGFKETIRLLHISWRADISKKAMSNMAQRKMGDIDQIKLIPLAKTVQLFMDYLVQKSQYLSPQLTCSDIPQEELYKEFVETVMCRVLLFNRRRVTEIQDIKLTTYDKVNSGRFYDLYKTNSLAEQIIMKKCKCVNISGRKEQLFPVYFSPEIVKDISMLRSVREKYFNAVDNPYLFGIPNTNTFMKGFKIMEKHGKIYDHTNYKSMSSMRYRKHVAILTQLFSMTWVDIHEILNALELKQEHRLPDDVEQVAKLCKILLAKDDFNCQGKAIDEVDLDMEEDVENLQDGRFDAYEDSDNESNPADMKPIKFKKEKQKRIVVRWTPKQKQLVINHFSDYIKKCQLPKSHECNLLKEKYPDLLHNKDWIKIKAFVQNMTKKKKT